MELIHPKWPHKTGRYKQGNCVYLCMRRKENQISSTFNLCLFLSQQQERNLYRFNSKYVWHMQLIEGYSLLRQITSVHTHLNWKLHFPWSSTY